MRSNKIILLLIAFSIMSSLKSEKGGRIGQHGQMLFFSDVFSTDSKNSIVLYTKHLGGHSPPHDYQDVMIGRLELEQAVTFKKDQVYHFLPKEDSLDDWISGALDTFTGDLHDGTFYQGKVICKGKLIRLKAIWTNQLIDNTPTLPTPKYVVFNKLGNVYNLEHYLEGKELAFPLSIRAEIIGESIKDGEILQFDGLRNIKEDKLIEGKDYSARILGRKDSQFVTVRNVVNYVNPDEKKGGLKFLEMGCHHLE
jgi:hypothetical protein